MTQKQWVVETYPDFAIITSPIAKRKVRQVEVIIPVVERRKETGAEAARRADGILQAVKCYPELIELCQRLIDSYRHLDIDDPDVAKEARLYLARLKSL